MLKLLITAFALLFSQQISPMQNESRWEKFQRTNPKGLALHVAADKGDIMQVERLIQEGVCVNIEDPNEKTALYTAAANGHIEVCKLLIKNGAHTVCGWYSLPIWRMIITSSWIKQNFNVIELLLNPHNLPTQKACSQAMITFLYCLKKNKKKDLVSGTLYNESKTLLRPHYADTMRMASHDVNEKANMYGDTALMDAVHEANVNACQWIIQRGADVNIQYREADETTTALSIARSRLRDVARLQKDRSAESFYAKYTKICELLIANGAIEDEAYSQ